MKKMPGVSVVVPCRNEAVFIREFIRSVMGQDYPKDKLEVVIVDGESDDGTTGIIRDLCRKHRNIRCVNNPFRTIPHSLNLGISRSRKEYIVRMDVHSLYPSDYISQLVRWSEKLGSENTGGVIEVIPSSGTIKARVIADLVQSFFAIGNVQYRLSRDDRVKEVDTVPFGCFRRTVFSRFGMYDEEFLINEDDEYNLRLKMSGARVMLVPSIKVKYFSRDTFQKLFRQYFQYGYWKPKVMKKHKCTASIRHAIPPLFSLFLLSGLPGLFFRSYRIVYGLVFSLYLLFAGSGAAYETICKKRPLYHVFLFIPGLFIIHTAYGLGFLKGAVDFILLNRKPDKIGLTR
ncbi:MAG: glycosyltransferase family 2 protein [bacterium]|nr:glycosyltransferase family 2 protein [bacterium]